MQIQDIKSNIEITHLASHLGIEINERTQRAICPFHKDKKPSLQFSKEKQIATCFSSNCTAGTMDVIGLAEKKMNLSTHETLNYLSNMLDETTTKPKVKLTKQKIDYEKDFQVMQSSLISSSTARKYLQSRNLDPKKLSIGYNAFKASNFTYLRGCITFGLRDEKGKLVSMYGRSIRDNDKAKHYYTKNRTGLYPAYPDLGTTKIILTESIIDAATLLSSDSIEKKYKVLTLYGTNGLTTEILHALQQLESLQEIILWMDGDEAGRAANEKHANYLQDLFPKIKISIVETLENEDINSLLESHSAKILEELLNKRILFSSIEKKEKIDSIENKKSDASKVKTQSLFDVQTEMALNTNNPNKIIYRTETANYYIKGGIRKDLDSLKVSIVIEHPQTNFKSRSKVDLYEDKQSQKLCNEAAEKLNLRADLLFRDLNILTDLLDQYRESKERSSQIKELKEAPLTQHEKQEYKRFGKEKKLLQKINKLIGEAGIVGESSSRLFLFAGAVSHLMPKPINIVVQGGSGSGKSYLIKKISHLVPQLKVKRYTRLSEKSLYNFGEYDLCHCLIIIEDYDGMNEEVEYAFREIQSNEALISAVSSKEHENAEIQTRDKIVRGPIASMVATTKGEIYHDNSTRVFFISVDESAEQTQRIIDYKNKRANGEISDEQEDRARLYLQGFVKSLKSYKVKNPYLKDIMLPVSHDQMRRVHELLGSFCQQITLIHQHQRELTPNGKYLITAKEDMRMAINLLFDSIILKVDELDGSLRLFYEKLKTHVLSKGKDYAFTRREIRHEVGVSNTQLHRFMKSLLDLEYIYHSSGFDNKGHRYKISYWDDNEAMRNKIRKTLNQQLDEIVEC